MLVQVLKIMHNSRGGVGNVAGIVNILSLHEVNQPTRILIVSYYKT